MNLKHDHKILIVDDDAAICKTLAMHFLNEHYLVETAHNAIDGIALAAKFKPAVIILDIKMPGESGLEALPKFKQACANARILMITAFQDMKTTIEAMKNGADDYIHKPLDLNEIDLAVKKSLQNSSSEQDVFSLSDINLADVAGNNMVGKTSQMKEIFKIIGRVSQSPATVLITGDSGTGKELVAQAIHDASAKASSPFVAVNCAAIVETLLESDMFGHEKGSFTGAVTNQQGKFVLAKDGTIFLDEIGELNMTMQAKLLRVLQEKQVTPLGAKQPIKINARIISATNKDLAAAVKTGEFREDLYYRLQVVTIKIPPLKERMGDLTELVKTLLHRINKEMGSQVNRIAQNVMDALASYHWPGNIRELENTLMKAVALCPSNTITSDLLPEHIAITVQTQTDNNPHALAENSSLQAVEKAHVNQILSNCDWHKGKACKVLGVSRPRLRRLIAQYKLHSPDQSQEANDWELEEQ